MMISADNAHGIHPAYPDKHDERHGPLLNGGPVIKVNASQRYASSSDGGGLFRLLARLADMTADRWLPLNQASRLTMPINKATTRPYAMLCRGARMRSRTPCLSQPKGASGDRSRQGATNGISSLFIGR